MKNDKGKHQNKNTKKKKAADLEESLREKLFELVRSLGHDVVDVSEEIVKMSKRLTKKLSKTMKNALASNKDKTSEAVEGKKSKSKNLGNKKTENNTNTKPNGRSKAASAVSNEKPITSDKIVLESKKAKKKITTKAKSVAPVSTSQANPQKSKTQRPDKPITSKPTVSKKPDMATKTVKLPKATIKKENSISSSTVLRKASTTNPAREVASRKPTSVSPKKTTAPSNPVDVGANEIKRKPGRPRSTAKSDSSNDLQMENESVKTGQTAIQTKAKLTQKK